MLRFVVLFLCTSSVVTSIGMEFQYVRASYTDACVRARQGPTYGWGSLYAFGSGSVTSQSAQYFCRQYNTDFVSGGIVTYDSDCRVRYAYRLTAKVDCPHNATSDSDCIITGAPSSYYSSSYFYGVAIRCITASSFSTSSSFSGSSSTAIHPYGTYGSNTDRSLSLATTFKMSSIKPSYIFSSGTLCFPPGVNVSLNIAKALCRTAGLPATSKSSIVQSSYSAASYPKYISNISCRDSTNATLWNGGCSYTSHYYDTPSAASCFTYLPELSCPTYFDFKLTDPIVSSGRDNGYQLVQLRSEDSDAYDGIMCIYSSYSTNFANVMCRETYGSDIDFAKSLSYSSSSVNATIKEYLSSVRCTSSTYTSLSKCYATLTPKASQYPCGSYQGLVACKISEANTVFSLTKENTASIEPQLQQNPGKGYLMASVAAAGQTTPAPVCYNGFDLTAARAACRSIGYTPGENVTFTLSTSASTHAINNVTCPTSANKLTDCKLQYSGTGYKISYTARSVCSGRVYLDCDLGTPSVQFRMDSSRYLQARLYSDAEWGWVNVGSGVTSKEGYNAMCAHSTSSTGDSTVSKSFLTVSYCSTSASSHTDCTYVYTNGEALSKDFYCSTYYAPSSSSSSTDSSAAGLSTSATLGLALGIPMGLSFIVFICICCCCMMCRKRTPANTTTSNGMNIEMSTSNLPTAPGNSPPVYNFNSSTGNNTASSNAANSWMNNFHNDTTGGFSTSNNAVQPPSATSSWNNTYNSSNTTGPSGSPFGYSHNQQGAAASSAYPPHSTFQSPPSYPEFAGNGGGGIYGQPVVGTPYPPNGIYGGAPSYPLGMPAPNNNPTPPTADNPCAPAPYGRGCYSEY